MSYVSHHFFPPRPRGLDDLFIISRELFLKVILSSHSTALKSQGDSSVQQFIDNLDDYLFRLLNLDESCPKAKETTRLVKEKYFPEPVTLQSALSGHEAVSVHTCFL